jgi:hypothetical protein
MEKKLDRAFLKEHLGEFFQIVTRETGQLGQAYFGVLKEFVNDKVYLDTKIVIEYNNIRSIIIMDVN